jgi:hypothetical protein
MKFKLRPTPSTAVATLALFIALGGTSYALGQISGSQLRNRSVAGGKLEKHTVTGTEINVSTLPKVPAAHAADQALTAVNATNAVNAVNATSATSATSATNAVNAVNATNATNATNAVKATNATTAAGLTATATVPGNQISGPVANATNATTAAALTATATVPGNQISGPVANATNATTATNLAGRSFAQVDVSSSSATDVTILNDFGGLTLAIRCTGGGVDIDATSATNSASYGISGVANNNATNFVVKEGDFMIGQTVTDTLGNPAQATFSYAPSSTAVVSGTLTVFNNAGTCSVFGNAAQS